MNRKIELNEGTLEYTLNSQNPESISYVVNEKNYDVSLMTATEAKLLLKVEDKQVWVDYWWDKEDLHFSLAGQAVCIAGKKQNIKKQKSGGGDMKSPMPGKILKVVAEVGQTVSKGDSLIVMEAMKMEHTIKSSEDGIVDKVLCAEGELVDGGAELVILKTSEKKAEN